jgi:4-amino-4-deoxy-L-arabinose transferase-like glycosyltransferase
MKRKKHRLLRAAQERAQRARRPEPLDNEASTLHYMFFAILASGMFIRMLVFAYLGYFNNDNHLAVIDYVARNWHPPHAGQLNQGYHPPLYYFLAAPFLRLGNLPAVQALSVLLSVATLTMIAVFLRRLPWMKEQARLWCLALAAFHPQFVMFSLFISNDTLAIFVGALVFYQCWRAHAVPSQVNSFLLGIFLGLGLLTKAVFLVFVLPLMTFVWLTGRRLALPRRQILFRLFAVFGIAALLGCYKYLENFFLFGSATISNLDFGSWTATQKPTWNGVNSLFDVNILKLIRDPTISASTVHSYPLMIYGSFWYSLVPESTFQSNLVAPFHRLGSMIYLAALCPTILMVIGAGRIGLSGIRALGSSRIEQHLSDRIIFEFMLVAILVSNLFLIIAIGWISDVWSVFQGRLLFPSYFAVLVIFHAGLESVASSRLKANLATCFLLVLLLLFLAYIIVECWLSSVYPRNPLSMDHMPYTIDMNKR